MFEVGVDKVKNEIIDRLVYLVEHIFLAYEDTVKVTTNKLNN
jgi:hypothetical protein